MLNNICIYLNNRVLGEVRESTFNTKDGTSKRISFAISSQRPDNNGLYVKVYCYAFDEKADEILKLGLQDGDFVTVIAEHGVYKKGAGIIEDAYKVISVTPVRLKRKNENTIDEPKTNETSAKIPENHSGKESSNEDNVQLNAFMGILTGGLFS